MVFFCHHTHQHSAIAEATDTKTTFTPKSYVSTVNNNYLQKYFQCHVLQVQYWWFDPSYYRWLTVTKLNCRTRWSIKKYIDSTDSRSVQYFVLHESQHHITILSSAEWFIFKFTRFTKLVINSSSKSSKTASTFRVYIERYIDSGINILRVI